ncbi:MAG TPA: hypothetical protein VLG67_00495 [Candidatus Saccharimonadales bacterium]|nr:hypothetical protein [Candidatus Saccharimonadales bacterium]
MAENEGQLPLDEPRSVAANRQSQANHTGVRIRVMPSKAEREGRETETKKANLTVDDLTPAELASAEMGNNPDLKIAGYTPLKRH